MEKKYKKGKIYYYKGSLGDDFYFRVLKRRYDKYFYEQVAGIEYHERDVERPLRFESKSNMHEFSVEIPDADVKTLRLLYGCKSKNH